ncbi:MAG TPA: 23S rRNA (adenine(2503)-C(2))-methyltransferase RlmN [Phycisphaerae bacterium]|nr:23S rRNA (adenine(2503)-C(2))-methyltransferase RlmN [Phycisphaerae bacterium]
MSTTKPSILELDLPALERELTDAGMPRYRAGQVMEWIFKKRVKSFEQMTNLSLADRQMLDDRFTIFTGEIARQVRATDGTEKTLIRWPDGGLTESVMIPCDDDRADDYGRTVVAKRRTACLSTQVGCPVGCAFCASGLQGFKANLTVGNVVEEALRLAHLLPEDLRLTNVVFMGMGEPLANFDVTVGAVKVLMAPWAFHISGRKITVSTVGLPPQIRRLADVGLPVTLAISLHAPNDELRKQIIPWAKGISIEVLAEAGEYYFQTTGRELTLEYIMLDGVNILPEHARELAAIAKRMRANVNLIYYNEVPDLPFRRPSGQAALAFQNQLRTLGVNVHIRRSRGRDIAAACGQLARQDVQLTAQKA